MLALTTQGHERLKRAICPDCYTRNRWQGGPTAGLCTNIYCGACGAGFNVGPEGFAERIRDPDPHMLTATLAARPKPGMLTESEAFWIVVALIAACAVIFLKSLP